MSVGRVKWYDKSKGYGFIESPEGDVFFHFSDIMVEGFKALAEDQRVSYKPVRSEQGLKAKQILPLDSRASVRRSARYRTIIYMLIKPGREEDFNEFFLKIPAWFDAMEQDLGLRRIGTWRNGQDAVHLVESDRPYEQSIEEAESRSFAEAFGKWRKELRDFLADEPIIMDSIQAEVPQEADPPPESDNSE